MRLINSVLDLFDRATGRSDISLRPRDERRKSKRSAADIINDTFGGQANVAVRKARVKTFLESTSAKPLTQRQADIAREAFDGAFVTIRQPHIDRMISMIASTGHRDAFIRQIESGDCLLPERVRQAIIASAPRIARRPSSPASRAVAEPVIPVQRGQMVISRPAPEPVTVIEDMTGPADAPDDVQSHDVAGEAGAPEPEAPMTIVELDGPLVIGSDIHETGESRPGRAGPRQEQDEVRTQPRLDWITDALHEKGVGNANLILYRQRVIGPDDKSPYYFLEVRDGAHHFQIAVCPVLGHSTFILRTPFDFSDEKRIHIDAIRADKTAFRATCYSREQWLASIFRYAYTALPELPQQVKTRVTWRDLKNELVQSVVAFHGATATIPMTGDRAIIEHGPLANKTSWYNAYHALQRGAITGLEGITNFRQVFNQATGAGSAPAVCKARFDACDIFAKAARHILEHGTLPQDAIDGIPVARINRALQRRAVDSLDSILPPENASGVRCLGDFLVATGLAEKKGRRLVPAAQEDLLVLDALAPART